MPCTIVIRAHTL